MTSETETFKTNEFLRRRKLRLQQVREQSKDIAKKIRQRAKVETLRQVVDLDAKKQKDYFDRQEKLVKRLEVLYARGRNNVGASHQCAFEVAQQNEVTKTDLSKLRGKEATAELRKKRQEKLDEQKKLLDRKLHAREAANEISRDKSSLVANKLSQKSTVTASKVFDATSQPPVTTTEIVTDTNQGAENENEAITKNDMATQWDVDIMPNEWEPAVPVLSLPKDDQGSLKEDEHVGSKSDKSKRLDLFALSNEMPSDLRGMHVEQTEPRNTVRPSLTLVSEYLQSRKLRLRESDLANTKKKSTEDITSLRQTILRSRNTKAAGSCFNVCHVLDEQVIPVPSWRAERSCEYCSHSLTEHKSSVHTKQFKSVTNSQINRIFSSIRPVRQSDVGPSPVLRSTSPFRRNKVCHGFIPGKQVGGTCTSNLRPDNVLTRKSSVQMYNHNTRDTRELPCSDEQFVMRDLQPEEDAYSQALKEISTAHGKDKDHHKKVQDMRSKVAVTKQTVEKEYKDTINFLNSLPKDTRSNKITKTAYMDDRRQQMVKESRQLKMQQEFRKIERECRRHHSCMNKSRSKSKSPSKQDIEDDFESRDFQYSWMPVPESDGNLAIHTIPNTVKEGKSGNSVKFSKVDSYHEYRSRHKHTPPTKDTASHEKHSNIKGVKAVMIENNSSESDNESSTASNTSSVDNLRLGKETKGKDDTEIEQNSSDAERIIIYKILDSKASKHNRTKKKNKLLSDIAKSLTNMEKKELKTSAIEQNQIESTRSRQHDKKRIPAKKTVDNSVSFEQINEGVYRVAEQKGDNIAAMYYSKDPPIETEENAERNESQTMQCKTNSEHHKTGIEWETADNSSPTRTPTRPCSTTSKEKEINPPVEFTKSASTSMKQPSAATSTSSFKSATNDKTCNAGHKEGGYIKLIDETGQEAGKFFLGSAGFLKDNAYEVVIQLRKKDNDEKSPLTELPDQNKFTNEGSSGEIPRDDGKTGNLKSSKSEKIVQTNPDTEVPEVLASKSSSEGGSNIISPRWSKQSNSTQTALEKASLCQNTKEQNIPRTKITDENMLKPSEEKNYVSDKGTLYQEDYVIPMLNFDPPSRPATNTYTQTTNSPIHRPIYFHMSSSTSTAYMSPPELILPKFLKRNSFMTEDETSGVHNINPANKHINFGKNGKKCKHGKKASIKKPIVCRRNKLSTPSTPPNSAKSRNTYDPPDSSKGKGRKVKPCKKSKPDKSKCKCNSCGVRNLTKNHMRKHCQKEKNVLVDLFRSSQTEFDNKFSNTGNNKNNAGVDLNPIVKKYVNKLLALNRESLKAIEVADQECSSVGTPGSSIINVPCNIDERKSFTGNKISLEQIKQVLIQQILDEHLQNRYNYPNYPYLYNTTNYLPRKPRKKPVHKVKSLNISKHLLKNQKSEEPKPTKPVSSSTTTDDNNKTLSSIASKSRPRSSPPVRQIHSARPQVRQKEHNTAEKSTKVEVTKRDTRTKEQVTEKIFMSPRKGYSKMKHDTMQTSAHTTYPLNRATITDTSLESVSTKDSHDYYKHKPEISMSTQTNQNIDSDFMKLAEDKLQNMEKIADLTEKCTKRLSNLAKVLEEVRKNKSLVYSQISTSDATDSQSDHKSDKVVKSSETIESADVSNRLEVKSPEPNSSIPENDNIEVGEKAEPPIEFISFLTDIPKPNLGQLSEPKVSTLPLRPIPIATVNTDISSSECVKSRPKPPPALSRIHLKHGREYIIPHELSTVMEVDSPMSVKNKNQSSRNELPSSSNRSSSKEDKDSPKDIEIIETTGCKDSSINPDLLKSNSEVPKPTMLPVSQDETKFQMIDIKHFNEIMLEPFISINEYARKYNVEAPDEGSNIDDLHKDDAVNDDMSSLHSDGSLPDVIAELLKRNIITEPFKFDTGSNINSTTLSSESTLSILALSKTRKGKKRSNIVFQNKENIGETSDTMSISSNPDLENAFKKLGMGWASSTLKKTKERLALSSSSNTSSSSISQFKMKSFNQDIPALVTDSVSSVLLSKKEIRGRTDNAKNVEQQTSLTNSMTVKEFLTNELANKITFNNKSGMNDTEDEFVSLFETKMPEDLKQQTRLSRDEHSNDSIHSGANRARTSTPVQIYKSMTYQSSSSSNVSNGLFSNADDLSSVKMTSNSIKNHSTSDKDDLTIPNFSLKMKKGSDCSKSD